MIWPFILLSYGGLLVYGLCDSLRGPLFPEILAEFAVSDAAGSLMFALASTSGLVASLFARLLLWRFERILVLRAAALGLFASLLGLAAAQSYWLFLACSVCFGLSLGFIGLIPNILVALGSTKERKQQLLAGLHAMFGISSLLAPLLAASASLTFGSWRWAFALASLAPLALLVYTRHSSHALLHRKDPEATAESAVRSRRNFWPQTYLALMLGFAVIAEVLISSRMALYMRRTQGADLQQSSLYTTYFFIALLTGRLLFAAVRFRASLIFQLSTCLLLSAALLFAGLYLHPLFLAATGFGIAPFYPLAIALISNEFPDDLDTAVSHMMATGSLMLIVMHLLAGQLSDAWGLHQALLVLGPTFLLLALLICNSYGWIFKRGAARHSA